MPSCVKYLQKVGGSEPITGIQEYFQNWKPKAFKPVLCPVKPNFSLLKPYTLKRQTFQVVCLNSKSKKKLAKVK